MTASSGRVIPIAAAPAAAGGCHGGRETLSQEKLLELFAGSAVGRDVQLEPATQADLRAAALVERPSLEIVYDTV